MKIIRIIWHWKILLLLAFLYILPEDSFSQRGYYIPKSLIIPLHDKSRQLHVSAGHGGGLDINLSYAFAPHFSVFVAGTRNKGLKKRYTLFDPYKIFKDDYVLKYGMGYFKNHKGWFNILETYGGYGIHEVDNYWYFKGQLDEGVEITRAGYRNIFWQINAGRKTAREMLALSARLSYSKYRDFLFYETSPYNAYIKSRYENLRGWNIDPGISAGYELKKVFINLQLGVSLPLTRVTVKRTDTHNLSDTTIIVPSDRQVVLAAFIGRMSLQYNFNFKRKN